MKFVSHISSINNNHLNKFLSERDINFSNYIQFILDDKNLIATLYIYIATNISHKYWYNDYNQNLSKLNLAVV